jgi:hypothetical protein
MVPHRIATARRALRGSFDPAPESVARGRAFMARRDAWRAGPQKIYARHADLEPFVPIVLAACFDAAVKELSEPPVYALRVDDWGASVRLTAEPGNWRWLVPDGTAQGRGLYELWAWRFQVPVDVAAAEIWALVAQHRAGMARVAA